ncbi:MAG: hydroxyacid dehydrogenase [Anaerolineae bacterium]|nr:hydroxyacid dehydrogenase [Anaerolineae bacterium]
MPQPIVLLYEPIHEEGMKVLRQMAQPRLASGTDLDAVLSQVRDAEGIIIRALGRVGPEVMDAAPRLKVVGRHGVGVDNVDIDAATERGIWVVNTPDAVTQPVAEHVVGMMIALIRRFRESDRAVRAGDWFFREQLSGFELPGKTLGVVGMGRIGYRTAQICRLGFGMEIVYCDVVPSPRAEMELSARRLDLIPLLEASDVVTLHTPYLPETHYLINRETIRHMRSTAFLINASRGKVVEQAALVRALEEGWIAGAGLDVFEEEPVPADNPLLKFDNVLLTPHAATSTKEALIGMSLVAKDVVAVLQGHEPRHYVNRPPHPRR